MGRPYRAELGCRQHFVLRAEGAAEVSVQQCEQIRVLCTSWLLLGRDRMGGDENTAEGSGGCCGTVEAGLTGPLCLSVQGACFEAINSALPTVAPWEAIPSLRGLGNLAYGLTELSLEIPGV